ncbi:hypothetical protein GCM10010421_34380 [Streptomyces glaucus]|uniref:Proline--tRNA ligase n=1 Tax=Streptomyces glaucus TaxID=284029 RepID=A0ABN3JXX7_9ACTN
MAKAPVPTPRADGFPRRYRDLIGKAGPAGDGPVRGTLVIRPYGYGPWERMQAETDARSERTGARNACFPLLVPLPYLTREAGHVEGFAPGPAGHAVTVRCLAAEDGSVPDDGDAPGNVAIVARAHRDGAFLAGAAERPLAPPRTRPPRRARIGHAPGRTSGYAPAWHEL